jgi:hypothetical protein
MRHQLKLRTIAAVALTATFALAGAPKTAHAEEVPPTGKGIAGGVLLGAEIVTMPMALANVQSGVAYGVGGAVGAIGGGVGGYFIEQGVDDGRIPVYMLAGGLALVIPTVVLILNATTYKPVEGAHEDRAPSGPPADPGALGGSVVIGAPAASPPPTSAPPSTTTPPATAPPATPTPPPSTPPSGGGGAQAPQSLIDFQLDSRAVALKAGRFGVPLPEVRPLVSQQDQKRLGLPPETIRGTEVRMPLVHVTF